MPRPIALSKSDVVVASGCIIIKEFLPCVTANAGIIPISFCEIFVCPLTASRSFKRCRSIRIFSSF